MLSCIGNGIVGRMAASMLSAVGLPELVTNNLADYEALATTLARDPPRLAAVRARLDRNRLTHPLFDTDRSRLAIEAAYMRMHEIFQRGEPPQAFRVDAVDNVR
jgi:predicted O-linked N-acetylglucosamine transferase (SPINDLY family)